MKKIKKAHKDLYQEVTDKIVAALESDPKKWIKPWVDSGMPENLISKKTYRGMNILLLWMEASAKGYATNKWATFKQISAIPERDEHGNKIPLIKDDGKVLVDKEGKPRYQMNHVLKGAKGTSVLFWKSLDGKTTVDEVTGEEVTGNKFLMCRAYTVFNIEQTSIDPDSVTPEMLEDFEAVDAAENFISRIDHAVKFNGGSANYSPATDVIGMPRKKLFSSEDDFYSTYFHELTHWTGVKKRLDRDMKKRFDNEAYGMEELVAELGSAFICVKTGIALEKVQHTEYIACWIKNMKADKTAIFTVVSKAQAAADYLEAGAKIVA